MLDTPPEVLYRDEWLLAVDKPVGIIVHGDGVGSDTLTDELIEWGVVYGREAQDLQALQRLDADTSGIVLFSLNKEAQPLFDRMIAERRISKRYRAIATGLIAPDTLDIRKPIGRDRHDSRMMRVSPTGKPAHTTVHVLKRLAADDICQTRTSIAIDLHTGRKHQIRVHMASMQHPLLGDRLYGRGALSSTDSHDLMLHASRIYLEHPITHDRIDITAPLPHRFDPLL